MRAEEYLRRMAGKLWPDLTVLDESERGRRLRELVGILYGAPLVAAGLIWLATASDWLVLRAIWPTLLLMLFLAVLLNQLDFFWIVERRAGSYDRWSAPLGGLVTISAALLFGPTAIWLGVIVSLVYSARMWRRRRLSAQSWNVIRNLLLNLSGFTLGSLMGLALYQRQGGTFPLSGLAWPAAPLAALAVLTLFGIDWLIWSCYLLIARWTQFDRAGVSELGLFAKFELVAYVPEFFAILAATVYTKVGIGGYLFLIVGALLVNVLAQRLSQAVDRSGQHARELAQLEQLGRAIIAARPDAAILPATLAVFVPPMFRYEQIEIRLNSGQSLLHTPAGAPPVAPALWEWLRHTMQPSTCAIGERSAWDDRPARYPLAAAPIISIDSADVLGGIYVRFSPAVDDPAAAVPALQSLAAQIASALYRAEEYVRALAHQKMRQELSMAAEIQQSFLPDKLPDIGGWQLAVTLRPAWQTSGDFYDLLELPDGRLGLLIADVTDKGTGAALFMALSRTLIRTYAFEYPDQPARVLQAANQRILLDSRSSMFVTLFYGILEPTSGTLTYCNAGHNPPYHLRAQAEPWPLPNTGLPLGIVDDATWQAETVHLAPGDVLVLYTDGVSEAHDEQGALFEVGCLLDAARSCHEPSAQTVRDAILTAVDQFVGGAHNPTI